MSAQDLEEFEKWFYSSVLVNPLESHKAAWQAALKYARSEGPEGSLHQEGELSRNMSWKESSEMMNSMASSLGKELKQYKEIAKSKVSEVNKLQAENKKLREALNMAIDSASFFQKFADCTKDSWSCRCEFCRDTSKTKNLARAREALKELGDL
jgi:regulator of replication initiation timing